jgi:hypothetical protein
VSGRENIWGEWSAEERIDLLESSDAHHALTAETSVGLLASLTFRALEEKFLSS